jgi:hypothetical protein
MLAATTRMEAPGTGRSVGRDGEGGVSLIKRDLEGQLDFWRKP